MNRFTQRESPVTHSDWNNLIDLMETKTKQCRIII